MVTDFAGNRSRQGLLRSGVHGNIMGAPDQTPLVGRASPMPDSIDIRDDFGELLRTVHPAAGNSGLRGASMPGAELTAAQLAGVDLEGADLYWCILFRANLSGARLRKVDLRGADLKEANLQGTDLEGARLGRDNLGGPTSLQGADLTGAVLRHADLKGATYDARTRFPDGFSPERAAMVRVDVKQA